MKFLLLLMTVLYCCVAAAHALQCYKCSHSACRDSLSAMEVETCEGGACTEAWPEIWGKRHTAFLRGCIEDPKKECPRTKCDNSSARGARLCVHCCTSNLCNAVRN